MLIVVGDVAPQQAQSCPLPQWSGLEHVCHIGIGQASIGFVTLGKRSLECLDDYRFIGRSGGTFGSALGSVLFAAPQMCSCASVTWFTTRAKVRISGVGLKL